MKITTFKNAKIGNKVWDLFYNQWFTIIDIIEEDTYPIKTKNSSYTLDGKPNLAYGRTLFWDEVIITPPGKTLPELEVDTKVIVWDSEGGMKQKRYFSHFDESGRMHVFAHGTTSWSYPQTLAYKYWILADA